METLKEEPMFADDECLTLAIVSRECTRCRGTLASFAFPQSEQEQLLLRELRKTIASPLFALMDKDEGLNRARVVLFAETEEEFFLTPKEFGALVCQYLDRHTCASWN
jgi:hypothetical protein